MSNKIKRAFEYSLFASISCAEHERGGRVDATADLREQMFVSLRRSCTPPLFIFNNYQPIANEFMNEFHKATETKATENPNTRVQRQSMFSRNATDFHSLVKKRHWL